MYTHLEPLAFGYVSETWSCFNGFKLCDVPSRALLPLVLPFFVNPARLHLEDEFIGQFFQMAIL